MMYSCFAARGDIIWVSTQNLSSGLAENKDTDQPVQRRSLISAFVILILKSIISRLVGACQVHCGLPVGFLLPRYSVLLTVESLSLLYLLVIS